MEAERRSTMSSLKGQLSNVEGSVKSMKVAVVVGSVLTVACLAAVFGVTVLANEVSKEVKVSNGTLTSKSGAAVLTTSSVVTEKIGLGAETLITESASFKVNAVVINGEAKTVICDDAVVVQENGETSTTVAEGSVLASVLGAEESVDKRSMNMMCDGSCPELKKEEKDPYRHIKAVGKEFCMRGAKKVKGSIWVKAFVRAVCYKAVDTIE